MRKNKEICIVSPIYPPDIGGPATYVFDLAQRLKKDYKINIVAFCESKPALIKNTDIYAINPKKYGFLGRQLRLFAKLWKVAAKAETLYIQGPIVVGMTSLIFAKIKGIKSIMKFVGDIAWEEASRNGKTELDLESWLQSKHRDFRSALIKRIQKITLNSAAKLVVPSQFLKNILVKYYDVDASKIELIYNAFEGEGKRKQHADRGYKIITAGRLVPHKKVDLIVEAVARLPEKYTLDIYGSGPEKNNIERKIEELNVGDRIKMRGSLSKMELLKVMSLKDIFVLYSSYEGLPHVVLEAFSSQCPVVASNIQGTNEVAIDNETAILAEPENPVRLAEAIRNLAWDKKLREQLSKRAFAKLKTDFDWGNHISKIKEIL